MYTKISLTNDCIEHVNNVLNNLNLCHHNSVVYCDLNYDIK